MYQLLRKCSKKALVLSLLLVTVLASSLRAQTNSYGIPEGIQEGNILHCFNWPINEVKNALPEIAAAGFGSVQLSPLQRADIKAGYAWHDLYRPYDLAFKASSGMGSAEDLKALCATAKEYGIKVIVDVVANHVDKTSGYHDTWWDSNGRVRWNGSINYNDRNSITHGQLGDYGDVNSEDSEVCARGKAYVQALKDMGVSGIRWDAAKHIGLPSESCNFWSSVTSVSGMWHYGEILDNPGPDASIIKEYCNYMSVTDNQYCDYAAKENGGIPGGYGGAWAVNYGLGNKCVYWAESHDTYSNDDGWSSSRSQEVIDRAYAAYACRNNATCLYLSRPNATGFNNIKIGKGSTHFTNKQVAEVNKFRNAMVGKKDYFSKSDDGSACSITRQDGGAVIVMKGSGNVSIANGGNYCPAGTYEDRVSGGTFTVTSTTISGTVGSSGIAVIYGEVTHDPSVTLSPNGGTFTSETQSVTATLNNATSGWYKIGDGAEQSFTGTTTFTIGSGMSVGESVTVSWGAEGETGKKTGSATFTKADKPNVYVRFSNTNNWSKVYVWAWNDTYDNLTSASAWPGEELTKDSDGLYTWTLPSKYDGQMPTGIIFSDGNGNKAGGDNLVYQNGKTYKGDGTVIDGDTPSGSVTITGDYNLAYSGTKENVHYWGGTSQSTYPGVKMTTVTGSDGKTYKVAKVAEGTTGILFNTNGDENKTGDLTYSSTYVMDDNGTTATKVTFTTGTTPTKPVITASPTSSSFKESITVTLSASPAATIYYTTDGTTPSTSSQEYSSALTFTETTSLKAFGVTSDGTQGEVKTFTYTKSDGGDTPTPGDNLITDYYKVNPNGQVGTFKTIDITGHPASSALSHWTEADLIAQGVARDVCQAYKGLHERPIVDSYAIYAAYDNDNLYLGVQFVYTVWDLGGEGKQPGESKPYNMDGHMCWAFDLDPNASFDGYINGTGPIWNEDQKGAKFANGVDAVWMGSTKPGTGTPGFFIPTPDGHASYDAQYCKASTVSYGYTDGLLSSIDHIWGQEFGSDPEALKGNTGFVDLKGEIAESAHTFYEFKFPLSLLGITADYIRNNGIGVMYIDKYGTSPVGGTPYDPSYFDNVKEEYSYGDNTSKEKEDEDIITYAPVRVGKLKSTGISNIAAGNSSANGIKVRAAGGRLYIESDKAQSVTISTVSGMTTVRKVKAGMNVIDGLAHGIYIVNRTKVVL